MRSLNQRRGRVSSGDKHTKNHGESLFLHPSRAQIHLYHLGEFPCRIEGTITDEQGTVCHGHHGVVVGARGDVVHVVAPLRQEMLQQSDGRRRIAGQSNRLHRFNRYGTEQQHAANLTLTTNANVRQEHQI